VGAAVAEPKQTERDEKLSFSAGLSTAGVSLETAYRFRPKWAIRGILGGGITVFDKGGVAGVDYDWRVRLGGVGILADYYPYEEGLRFSGGFFFPNTNITARAQGDLTIGNNEYSGARLNGNVEPANDVLPVISIGYVQPIYKRLSLAGDIGVTYTNGFVAKFDTAGGTAIETEDLKRENAEFRDKVWDVFPYLSITLSYRF
jgi:hypothetical protein